MTRSSKYTHNSKFFSSDSAESFYWAGFIAADGCISVNKNYTELSIQLSSRDHKHLIKFKKAIGFTGKISTQYKASGKDKFKLFKYSRIRITISKSDVLTDLRDRFNITPRKSLTYQFPEHLEDHPMINHFMRGYFDGDGCLSYHKRPQAAESVAQIVMIGTKHFIEFFKKVLNAHCDNKAGCKIIQYGSIWRYVCGGSRLVPKVLSFLYEGSTCAIRLDRKYKLAKDKRLARATKRYEARVKSVVGINDDSGRVVRYNSSYEAAADLGMSRGLIYRCLRGERKHSRGFRWLLAEEYDG
jgi:hypothetical protein